MKVCRRSSMHSLRGAQAGLVAAVLLLMSFGPTRVSPAQEIRYLYDDLNRLVGVVDPQGNGAEYVYDAVGNLLQIKRFIVDPQAVVSITLVSPNQGMEGSPVTILGQGFSATLVQNQVAFNGTAATVLAATPTTLAVTVPPGATSGLITLTAPLGNATSREAFTVLTLATVSPPTASLLLGTTQQFTATAPVFWGVNNIRGGNTTVGTISADGLYTAPATLPTPEAVTVTATHLQDARIKGTATVSLGARPEGITALPLSLTVTPAPEGIAPLVAPLLSLALSPGQASPLVAPALSLALAAAPSQAAPLWAPPVALRLDPAPASATPLLTSPLSLAREPVITGVSPSTGTVGSSVTLTLTGAGLTGATALTFERDGTLDSTLMATDLVVTGGGTQATATLTIAGGAPTGPRVVRMAIPGGTSTPAGVGSNVFTVTAP